MGVMHVMIAFDALHRIAGATCQAPGHLVHVKSGPLPSWLCSAQREHALTWEELSRLLLQSAHPLELPGPQLLRAGS